MTNPVIVEEYRGGKVENIHQGIICIVNDKKEVIYEKGNVESHVYYRICNETNPGNPNFFNKYY